MGSQPDYGEKYVYDQPGIGEIKKVGNLKSRYLSIKNSLRNTGIEKSCIGLVKISPFTMKKFVINELIQYKTFFQ
jgi:hypothetical protein